MRYNSKYKSPKGNYLSDLLQPTIKPLREYKRGELGIEILKIIALCGIGVTVVALPGSAQILRVFEYEIEDEKKVRKTLKKLKDNGFISKSTKNGKEMYQLTKRGTERIERYCIDNVTFPELEKWDGYWRLILFDIPNTKKRARDNLAYKLCDVGCVQFQKSIYAYPHSCKEELEIISKFYFVKKYVVYLTVNDSNEFDVLRRKFKGVGA